MNQSIFMGMEPIELQIIIFKKVVNLAWCTIASLLSHNSFIFFFFLTIFHIIFKVKKALKTAMSLLTLSIKKSACHSDMLGIYIPKYLTELNCTKFYLLISCTETWSNFIEGCSEIRDEKGICMLAWKSDAKFWRSIIP